MKFDRRFSQVENWRATHMTVSELALFLDGFLQVFARFVTAEQYEGMRKVVDLELTKVSPEMAAICREQWSYADMAPATRRRSDEH